MKFSLYNYVDEKDGKLVIINFNTSKYVRIKNKEAIEHIKNLLKMDTLPKDDDVVQALYEQGYVVDKDFDEYETVKKELHQQLNETQKAFEMTVFVTDQCNFRCIYCPENHQAKPLPKEYWEYLYKHIEKNVENGNYKSVVVNFFGGEPLLGVNKILNLLEKLDTLDKKHDDVIFEYKMVTNGYLLTPKIYDKLAKYNFNHFQITVDGFKESHDQMRKLVDGRGTWDKIIENLKYIATKDDGIEILLRTNHNYMNESSLKEFYKWINKTFPSKKFILSLNPVGKLAEKTDENIVADLDSDKLFEYRRKIEKEEQGERCVNNRFNPIRRTSLCCHAALRSSYALMTNGRIGKCEASYMGTSTEVGTLGENGDIIFDEITKGWFDNYEIEKCKTCQIYPLCVARACPVKKALRPDTRPDCLLTEERQKSFQKFFKAYLDNFVEEILEK